MKCAVLSALLFITPQDGEAAGDAGSVEWAGEWEVPGEAVQALDAVKQRVIGVRPGVPGGLLWSPKTSLFGYASGDSVGALHCECVCLGGHTSLDPTVVHTRERVASVACVGVREYV